MRAVVLALMLCGPVVAAEKTPLANVLLTFLDKINIGQDKLGDSTGKLVDA